MAVAGGNLSGRTHLLRCWTDLETWNGRDRAAGASDTTQSAYIGPEVYNSISGLATTVRQELLLHSPDALDENPVAALLEHLRLTPLFERNPFTLSGGEQTCLAVASALAMRPRKLAVDCPTEQLDFEIKLRLLKWMNNGESSSTVTAIADNRLAEYEEEFREIVRVAGNGSFGTSSRRLNFEPLIADGYIYELQSPACALALDEVEFRYGKGPPVLREVSAYLEPGLYLLDGRNGAGKTTLAKILCGVLKPSAGRVLVDRRAVRPWKQPGRVVAYHFQNPDLQLFSTSVQEEIIAGPRAYGLGVEECTRQADAVLAAFGLLRIRAEHPLDLPFVIRKRVALAATLAMGRPWTILDEPTLGQDDATSETLARMIANLLARGAGVILITHSQWFRRRLAAKILRLEGGVIEA